VRLGLADLAGSPRSHRSTERSRGEPVLCGPWLLTCALGLTQKPGLSVEALQSARTWPRRAGNPVANETDDVRWSGMHEVGLERASPSGRKRMNLEIALCLLGSRDALTGCRHRVSPRLVLFLARSQRERERLEQTARIRLRERPTDSVTEMQASMSRRDVGNGPMLPRCSFFCDHREHPPPDWCARAPRGQGGGHDVTAETDLDRLEASRRRSGRAGSSPASIRLRSS